jgi:hypothetical protein
MCLLYHKHALTTEEQGVGNIIDQVFIDNTFGMTFIEAREFPLMHAASPIGRFGLVTGFVTFFHRF